MAMFKGIVRGALWPFSDKPNKDYPGNAYGTYYVILCYIYIDGKNI